MEDDAVVVAALGEGGEVVARLEGRWSVRHGRVSGQLCVICVLWGHGCCRVRELSSPVGESAMSAIDMRKRADHGSV